MTVKNWVEWIGLGDGTGSVSFNKSVTFVMLHTFVFNVVYSLVALRQSPPLAVWSFGVIVIGSGLVLKWYLAGVARRNETFTHADSTNVSLTGDVATIITAVANRRKGQDTEDAP
jgi:hypothetical protein